MKAINVQARKRTCQIRRVYPLSCIRSCWTCCLVKSGLVTVFCILRIDQMVIFKSSPNVQLMVSAELGCLEPEASAKFYGYLSGDPVDNTHVINNILPL
jgi:hypothetical protein